jgi:Cdc6-like AAA superfamily ATPase
VKRRFRRAPVLRQALALPEPRIRSTSVRDLIERDLPLVFTSRSPVREIRFLQGRDDLIEDMRGALVHLGSAIVIYGERGVGKTSLAQLASEKLCKELPSLQGITPIYYSVSESDTYQHILGAVLPRLGVDKIVTKVQTTSTSGEKSRVNLYVAELEDKSHTETTMAARPLVEPLLSPQVVVDHLKGKRGVIILDDYERITDQETRHFFPELIKKISDNQLAVTLIIVGIGDSTHDLIKVHPSVERNLTAIHVPRLTDEQIRQIAVNGFAALRLKYEPEAVEQIVRYSANFPFYTHRLCEGIVRAYVAQARNNQRHDWTIRVSDVPAAIREAVRNSPPSLMEAYDRIKATERALQVAYIVASAREEPLTRARIQEYLSAWAGEDREIDHSLKKLVDLEVLQRPETGQYCFCNPLLRAYVILRFRADTPADQLSKIDAALKRVGSSPHPA